MTKLFIDTTVREKIILKLDNQVFEKEVGQGSQAILGFLDEVLKKQMLDVHDIKEVEVATGPGSFTGIRVGVAVAKALGFSLGILVNGKKAQEDFKLNYKQ